MSQDLSWKLGQFNELSAEKLYAILNLRCQVFVVEQTCPYLDVDYKDLKALHLCGYHQNELVAYCRLFYAGDYFEEASIGRVVVLPEKRKYGYGHQLMNKAIDILETEMKENCIVISAQQYLEKFYESHGFNKVSDMYLEDDIPHVRMMRK